MDNLETSVKNFAHRGFSGKYPENTMLAFEKAYEEGVDGIELDIQLTKDGEIVIIHDSKVNRTTNGRGYVKDKTLEEIRQLNAAQKFKGLNEKIPTLNEYLFWVADKDLTTNIEFKTDDFEYQGIEEKTIALVKEYHLQNRIIFSSFNHYTIQKVKDLAPEMTCGLLFSDWIVDFSKYASDMEVECAHPAFKMLKNKQLLHDLQDSPLAINAWTVNKEKQMRQLIDLGVTSIITNFPNKLNAVLQEM